MLLLLLIVVVESDGCIAETVNDCLWDESGDYVTGTVLWCIVYRRLHIHSGSFYV